MLSLYVECFNVQTQCVIGQRCVHMREWLLNRLLVALLYHALNVISS